MRKPLSLVLLFSAMTVQSLISKEVLSIIEKNDQDSYKELFFTNSSFDFSLARDCLIDLRKDLKNLYGIDLDVRVAIKEALNILKNSSNLSPKEISQASDFYSKILDDKCLKSSRWNPWGNPSPGVELELPGNMALGFMFVLSGALLSVLPFGITQGIGGSFIVSGLTLIIQDGAEGGKPYYVDTATGKRIDY